MSETKTKISAVAARIAAEQAAAQGDIETLLQLMRAYGVTRYRRGDLEIELAPAAAVERIWREAPSALAAELAAEQLGRAVREADYPQRMPISGPGPNDVPPNPIPDPPDEQPAVEIDIAATEELLRAQDARRRRHGA